MQMTNENCRRIAYDLELPLLALGGGLRALFTVLEVAADCGDCGNDMMNAHSWECFVAQHLPALHFIAEGLSDIVRQMEKSYEDEGGQA